MRTDGRLGQAKRFKELMNENDQLKRLLADAEIAKAILKKPLRDPLVPDQTAPAELNRTVP